jgi:negative regulator of sigma E activity
MRPDRETISAYIDGEVLPPHREVIAEYIENDEGTRLAYEELRRISRALPRTPDAHLAASAARSWAAIGSRLEASRHDFWHRAVALPAPLVAAAATAVVALAAAFVWLVTSGMQPEAPQLSDFQDAGVTLRVDQGEIDHVVQWLVERENPGEVNIRLPEQQFRIKGEPLLIRRASYPPEQTE